MTFSEILNIVLGGSMIGLVVSLLTMKATIRKAHAEAERAKAEAEKAKADAETVHITNAENATRILVENIVKPLKEELNATRKDLQATKREMARLRKAVEAVSDCPHSDNCPVRYKLLDNQKDPDGTQGECQDSRETRYRRHNHKTDCERDSPNEPGGDVDFDR
ncbi:MAG: hypothetical protein J1E16_09640 [Muribaculaceae bacterium]|nr:hypothetical protein [Muribaculaceae bacterium]